MNTEALHFHLDTDQNLIAREVPSQRVLEISLQAPGSAAKANRPPLNLALVLDRSGSMSGEKLEYVKRAAEHVLDLLQEQDLAAVVAYDDEINLLSPSVAVTGAQRSQLKRLISTLRPGASTNLSGGWLAGCQEAAAAAKAGMLSRCLLLTDGLANVGITDLEALAVHARELSRRGVSTSTFGVGEGFNEHLLEAMSNQGGGSFYYIETPSEIPALFEREFKELAAVTAREVEIVLEFPANVSLQVLGGWASEFNPGRLSISLGSLYANKSQQIFIKALTPPDAAATDLKISARVSSKDEAGLPFEERAELVFQYTGLASAEAAPKKSEVLERFAQVDLAETANEALKLERQGRREQANKILQQSIQANAPHIAPSQAAEFQAISERMQDGMTESDRKSSHYQVYNQKRQRGS